MKNLGFILIIFLLFTSCSLMARKKCEPPKDSAELFMEGCLMGLAIYTRSKEIPPKMIQFCASIYELKKSGQAKIQITPIQQVFTGYN